MIREYVTGTTALNYAFSGRGDMGCKIISARLHLSEVGGTASEPFTVQLDSVKGAAWDHVFHSQDMQSLADDSWTPADGEELAPGEEMVFSWANAQGRTYGLEILYVDQ